jgi:cytochrome P450
MMASHNSRFPRLLKRFDPFDPEFEEHFFEVAGELRQQCPVVHSDAQGGFWAFSRFDDVLNGFADADDFTTVPTVTIPPNPGAVPLIPLQCEPEIHREFRRLLDPYFRAGAVAKYEAGIREITTNLIDSFIEQGHCEFVADFARRLPGGVIFRLFLGLPESEVDEAFYWTMAIMHGLGTPEAALIHQNFMNLIARLVERRKAEPRRDDVVDALLHGKVVGRPLTMDEILRTLLQLIAAGMDTTAHALGNMIVTLTEHPALLRRLEAEPGLLPKAIEELLRWEPPAGGLVRTASRNVVVGGKQLMSGDRVLLLVAAANRDPKEFDSAGEVNIEREQIRHLAFGHGSHYCIGVHLARLELRVALEVLLSRLKGIRIAENRVKYDSGCSRGPTQLNIEFTPDSPRQGTADSE